MQRKGNLLFVAVLVAMLLTGCATTSEQVEVTKLSGTGKGNNGDITVEVSMGSEGDIVDVQVIEHSETEGICEAPFEALIPLFIEQDNTEVETVAGATNTSKGLIEAVNNAMGAKDETATDETTETEESEERYAGSDAIDAMDEAMATRREEYAPEIVTLENGVQLQRTPDDIGGYWHNPGKGPSYNTYYLKADDRGCNACHDSLIDLVDNSVYEHLDFGTSYGMDMTAMDCLQCHGYGPGYLWKTYEFGSLIHGIHDSESFDGNCNSCHNATGDGRGMMLWDEVKYDVLQGISSVANVEGEFVFDQDVTTAAEDMFFANWFTDDIDAQRNGADMVDAPLDEGLFNNWTITVEGLVDEPYTINLVDLIELAEKEGKIETQIIKNHCVMNPAGGPWIGNIEVTGIDLQWVIEQAGVQSEAIAYLSVADNGWNRGSMLDSLYEDGSLLVYEMDGEKIPWGQGYPVVTYNPGQAAPGFIRRTNTIQLINEVPKMWQGWQDEDGVSFTNKPSTGIFHFLEGQIIEAGVPYIFEGYADAFTDDIANIEFSMDRGATWTTFETPDAGADRWVYWYFTTTLENPGSYVLSVRSTTTDGLVGKPREILVTVK